MEQTKELNLYLKRIGIDLDRLSEKDRVILDQALEAIEVEDVNYSNRLRGIKTPRVTKQKNPKPNIDKNYYYNHIREMTLMEYLLATYKINT